eukprot:TRINITY_DN10219_c0_g1_i1.p1 TRINITY_DN10219_c0_g1~~TRINITY_DN10219_c0_g1_i1.p1  ORF type:complete len:148 (+),score=38.97 TRINITY_DN10219_c0_g1_i1:42-485(+)
MADRNPSKKPTQVQEPANLSGERSQSKKPSLVPELPLKNEEPKADEESKRVSKQPSQEHVEPKARSGNQSGIEDREAPPKATPKETAPPAQKKNAGSLFQSVPLREFYDQTLSVVLLEGLKEVGRQRPANPVQFLGKFLLEHDPERK